ncbi:spectrin beta chain, non-erythrocytic 4-like isoform 3-T3 [Morphnus guianensis]
MRIHSLENVDKALQFLKEQRVHLENVGSHDIVDGNHRLTLGLIWTIILRFQIQVIKIKTEDNRETRSAKDALLLWCQMKTAGYPEVNIQNFTTSWRDGLAFNALIHKHRPDLIDFHKLTKSNATYNLQQAFNTAEQQLGLSKLLDPEDVNMEDPDEKSIITYVVSFYHYFSKMKALAVEGKRIGKVLDQAMEIEAIIERYEALSAELLAWIQHTITIISNQKFANSLTGVQQQLQAFTTFCILEKPIKFQEKGNLEVLLFTIQSKLRANNHKLYVPSEGKSISDINKAWTCLEKAEHEREVSLRNELIRQEKLELLAQHFDHKAVMREMWLNENQRLVSQDNFGYDLPAVEAAMKKHEAIEADISSYQERIQVVVELALEMESEGYYDTKRISAQKDNILRQWGLLTELVRARRARLEQNLALQKIFQEMVYMIDWMEEMQVLLVSKDLGKHLLEVEDLLQKHGLLEADISAQTERVQALNAAALKFSELEGNMGHRDRHHEDQEMLGLGRGQPRSSGCCRPSPLRSGSLGPGYQPCDPQIICNRVNHIQTCLEELGELAGKRRKELEDSCQLWAFFQEMEEAEVWIHEKEQILATKTCGRDLSSVLTLTNKHKSMLGELGSRRALLHQTMKRGEQILAKKRFSPGGIQEKMREVRLRWKKLEEVMGLHQQRLQEALNFFHFSAETDDLVAWLQDTYRIVSSDDFGHDDYSTQALLRKHRAVVEEVEKHRAAVLALRKQLALLAPEHRQGVDVQIRVVEVEQLYGEVAEVAMLRQQWLQDALAVYHMFSEVHACEVWVDEKEQWLERMEVPEELDEVEVVQHRYVGGVGNGTGCLGPLPHRRTHRSPLLPRFESLDQEMNSVMGRILDVNQVVQQLVDGGHPSSEEVRSCQDHLNSRWNRVVELVEHKKSQLSSVLKIQNYLLECGEMKAQVREKRKAIKATQSGGSDLGGVLALQRHLSTMEAALVVLEPRLVELQREGEALAASHPGRALEILLPLEQISEEWEALKRALQGCEDSLIVAGRLQQFIQDLDNFLSWLVKTQAAVASEEVPDSLAEAERLLNQHAALKEEINGYEEDYAKIQAASDLLALEETEVPYLSLQQWLQKLDVGWGKLLQSWETRREVLVQSHVFHLFLRDVQQCETSLYNQESTLVHAELPDTVEGVSNAIKKHKDFTTTMDLNLQKIQLALQAGESLQHQGNLYSDHVAEAMESLHAKSQRNYQLAQEWMQRLEDHLELQWFLQDCHELDGWIREKVLMAGDPSRDPPPRPPKPWLKHQAFMAELAQNKEWLEKIEKEGEELLLAKPELADAVRRQLEELRQCWVELETTSQARSRRLAEAAATEHLARSYADMEARLGRLEEQLETVGAGADLLSVSRQLKRLQTMESQMEEWYKEVGELQVQAAALPAQAVGRQAVGERQSAVGTRIVRLIEPLKERRRILLASKEVHQVSHELEDEVLWVQDRLPLATLKDHGTNLQTVQQFIKKNQNLRREIQVHRPRVDEVLERAGAVASIKSPEAEGVRRLLEHLGTMWGELQEQAERRQQTLDATYQLEQYYFDVAEVESWLGEQELLLMSEEKGKVLMGVACGRKKFKTPPQHLTSPTCPPPPKDEQSTLQLLKKHLLTEQTVENYEETITQLSRQCRALLELGHPQSEQVSRRQSQVDRLYVSLKDLVEERKAKLEQQYWLYQLNREVDELEHWIAEKEVVAGSPELGQDFEHVTVSWGMCQGGSWHCLCPVPRVLELSPSCAEGPGEVPPLGEGSSCGSCPMPGVLAPSWSWTQPAHHAGSPAPIPAWCCPLLTPAHPCPSQLLQEKFLEFASETGSVGQERITAVNQMVDELIDYGHTDAATIAEWKDGVNEAWADLLELMETRAQMLAASHELHKFFNDCKEVLGQIEEKRQRLPELAAREGRTSAGALQRALGAFEHDVEVLVTQVRQLQEGAAQLRTLYAGDNAEAIAGREQEVLRAWKELLAACEECRLHVASVADKIRFVSTVRDLLTWMDGVLCQIGTREKPRDVSSVELLMNDHQGLKSEIEARGKSIAACLELGKNLILSKSPAADEIKAHVEKLLAKKKEMMEKWDKHWEWLQQSESYLGVVVEVVVVIWGGGQVLHHRGDRMLFGGVLPRARPSVLPSICLAVLEVHQFAQEAVVADAWLTAQEPLLKSQELGSSVDEVEQLIRRHEAFRKAATAWEERFSSLRRLTMIEKLKAEQNKQPPTPLLSRKFLGEPPGGSMPSPGGSEHPESCRLEPRVAYVRHELRPERLQPKLDSVQGPPRDGDPMGEPTPPTTAGETPVPPKTEEPGEARTGLLERHRERRERRLEQQESSEPEPPRHDGKGGGKATLADIVEQLQEKEAGGPLPALPRERESPARLPTGPEALPERMPRPDRPRARDRPKPRRRPRPKDPAQGPGETRRSRSAPAQGSAPPPPPPPTHTVQHEGFLFRKHELDGPNKKASNRSWVNLYCVLSKGDLGFYKDAKGQATGSTHGGEPLLNLHHSTSEVANDYKKKKNVFKLKTSDGSEFLLQAKDEEDMRGWLRALAACTQEHAEVARWSQALLTTSSTDEGLPRREGDRRSSTSGRRK